MKDLILPPAFGNRTFFPWLLIYQARDGSSPPQYFLTHGKNFAKFADRPGFRIVGHIKEKADAIAACRWYNDQLRPRKGAHQSIKSLAGVDLKALGLKSEPKPRLFIPKHIKINKDNKDG